MTGRANKNSKRYDVLAAVRQNPRASFRELCDAVGIRSLSVISYHLTKLEEEGLISRNRYQALGIEMGGTVSVTTTRTREIVRKLINANPQITRDELSKQTRITAFANIQYHIDRLTAQGLINWQPVKKIKKRENDVRWERGNTALPKMSRLQEQARIEMVVAKAQSRKTGLVEPGEDVIRITRGPLFSGRLKASKIG
ncbi:MAG: winged helix-turn-helix domain-containing protein [Chloroflexota bacterium]